MAKKVFLAITAALLLLVFNSCSNDDENTVVIQNLTGFDWYDAEIWYRDVKGGDLEGYTEVGTVEAGGTCTVDTDHPYFYVYAKNVSGKLVMSTDITITNGKANVTSRDLLTR